MKYDESVCKFNTDTGCVELRFRDEEKFPSIAPESRMRWTLPWLKGVNWTISSTMTHWAMPI